VNKYFHGSPSLLLSEIFPDYDWLPWKFERCPNGFWDNIRNQKKFLEWAANELKIKNMSDWYNVSKQVTGYLKLLMLRISTTLELAACCVEYIMGHHPNCLPPCTLTTIGYHGNLTNVLSTTGTR
jgi:hypothetical protein